MHYMKQEIVATFSKSLENFKAKRFAYGRAGPKEVGQVVEMYLPRQVGKTSTMVELALQLEIMGGNVTLVTPNALKYNSVGAFRYGIDAISATEKGERASISSKGGALREGLLRKASGFRVILIDEVPLSRIEDVVNEALDYDTFVFVVSTDY